MAPEQEMALPFFTGISNGTDAKKIQDKRNIF